MALIDDLKKKIAKAKNDLDASSELFNEKVFYYEDVFPNGKSPWPIRPIDLINENPLYGRVNMDKDFVFPKKELLRTINSEAGMAYGEAVVLNFVAEAFEDLRAYIVAHVDNGYIKAAGDVAECKPYKTYYDIKKVWKKYRNIHYGLYTLQYLEYATNNDPVRIAPLKYRTLKDSDFMKHFNTFMGNSIPFFPLSMSGVVASKSVSPLFTGLCVEIGKGKYDDDEEKQKFINHPNFNFFQLAARKHGFFLDRNVPWRLVADLNSHKMREYARINFERPLREAAIKEVYDTHLDETFKNVFPNAGAVDQMLGNQLNSQVMKTLWNMDDPKTNIKEGAALYYALHDAREAEYKQIGAQHHNKWEHVSMIGAKVPSYTVTQSDETGFYLHKNECDEKKEGVPQKCSSRVFKIHAIFSEYFEKVSNHELRQLEETMYDFWNTYVITNPAVKITESAGCQTQGFKTSVVKEYQRENISEEDFKEKYGTIYWLKFYLDVKILENKIKWPTAEYNRVLKRAYGYYKILDKEGAFRYLGKEIKKRLIGYEEIYKDKEKVKKETKKLKPLGSGGSGFY